MYPLGEDASCSDCCAVVSLVPLSECGHGGIRGTGCLGSAQRQGLERAAQSSHFNTMTFRSWPLGLGLESSNLHSAEGTAKLLEASCPCL